MQWAVMFIWHPLLYGELWISRGFFVPSLFGIWSLVRLVWLSGAPQCTHCTVYPLFDTGTFFPTSFYILHHPETKRSVATFYYCVWLFMVSYQVTIIYSLRAKFLTSHATCSLEKLRTKATYVSAASALTFIQKQFTVQSTVCANIACPADRFRHWFELSLPSSGAGALPGNKKSRVIQYDGAAHKVSPDPEFWLVLVGSYHDIQ